MEEEEEDFLAKGSDLGKLFSEVSNAFCSVLYIVDRSEKERERWRMKVVSIL